MTIEVRGAVEESWREGLASRVFGCDICQDVCPWNVKFAHPEGDAALAARAPIAGRDATDLADWLLALDEPTYREEFRGSAMKRAKLDGLQRNAAIVRANLARD
jgi:epoxyqueuosine reductase